MQELLVSEGQLIQRRTEFEIKQKQLCQLLNSSPIEFDENISISLAEINQKIQDHLKMLEDLKVCRSFHLVYDIEKSNSFRIFVVIKCPPTM